MAEQYFNWEHRPAVIRGTPAGGLEAFFVPVGANEWSRANPVEVMESGNELSSDTFLEMFPDLPELECNDDLPSFSEDELLRDAVEGREGQKAELIRRGFSNALAEAWLDRSRYPRPPGWHSVFFYPGSMRPRNTTVFWLAVLAAITWFAF